MADTASDVKLILWVRSMLRRRLLLCVVGALACFVGALVVLWLTWWAIYGILWFVLLSFEPPAVAVSIAAWIIFGLLFVAYFTANRERLEHAELESPARQRVTRAAALLTDSPFLALAGPKTVGTFVRVVAVIALVGPGMLMTGWKMLAQAGAAWRAAPERVAEILKTLAAAGVRLPLEELTRLDPSDRMPTTFAAVRLFDGVILRTSEPVGLVISGSLRNAVFQQSPPAERQAGTTKPPPVKVSLKGAPASRSAAPPQKSASFPKPASPAPNPAAPGPKPPPPKSAAPPPPKSKAPPASPKAGTPPPPAKPKPRPKPPP